jgi:spectinomycin phosphotransferase
MFWPSARAVAASTARPGYRVWVKDRPAGVADQDLVLALARGWGLEVTDIRYAPVGAGGYHWIARCAVGGRWFVTVDDLDSKPWLGDSRDDVLRGLRAALDTARALRDEAGLTFVSAPEPARGGGLVRRFSARYALSVFGYLDGASGHFGEPLPAAERAGLAAMLAALHGSSPAGAPVQRIGLPRPGALEQALGEVGHAWSGGPYAEPARALLAGAADGIRQALAAFTDHAARFATAPKVITHGEPHPGNLIQTKQRLMLIDWDTVGLAPRERDLWLLPGDALDRYAATTGRPVDPAGLRLYRLRWALDDIRAFTEDLRAPHAQTPGAEQAWQALRDTVRSVAGA